MSIKENLDFFFNGMQCVSRRTFLTAAAAMAMAGVASGQPHTIGLKLGMNGNGNQQGYAAAGALQPADLAGAPGYAANQLERAWQMGR